ncbi:MAG: hypothetical protein HFI33_04575 [Lachnospiraceae bacterium]|nr:hypothetical protein [Lachnospiraceae bacterium]
MRKKKVLSTVCGILSGFLCISVTVMPVQAEEVAGYHERITTETEAVDNWYSVERGAYISFCTTKISDAGKGKVTISGSTSSKSVCDELKLALYLDESSNNSKYGTIGVHHYKNENAALVSGYEADVRVTSGYYYRARGVHTVIKGDTIETTDSCTGALTAS